MKSVVDLSLNRLSEKENASSHGVFSFCDFEFKCGS